MASLREETKSCVRIMQDIAQEALARAMANFLSDYVCSGVLNFETVSCSSLGAPELKDAISSRITNGFVCANHALGISCGVVSTHLSFVGLMRKSGFQNRLFSTLLAYLPMGVRDCAFA